MTLATMPNELLPKVCNAVVECGGLRSLFALGRTSKHFRSVVKYGENDFALTYAKAQTGNHRVILERLYALPDWEMRGWDWVRYGLNRSVNIDICVSELEEIGGIPEFFKVIHLIPGQERVILSDDDISCLKSQISTYLLGAELMSLDPTILEDKIRRPVSDKMQARYLGATLAGLDVVMIAFIKRAVHYVEYCEGDDINWLRQMDSVFGVPGDTTNHLTEGVIASGSAWFLTFFKRQRRDLTRFFGDIELEHAMLFGVVGVEYRWPLVSFSQKWKPSDKANKEDVKAWTAMSVMTGAWSESVPGEKARMDLMKRMTWVVDLPEGTMQEIAA